MRKKNYSTPKKGLENFWLKNSGYFFLKMMGVKIRRGVGKSGDWWRHL